jgi:hypothetical protein
MKNRMINDMVMYSADIMESKSRELEMIAEQYEEKGDLTRAEEWRKDIQPIMQAVALIRSRGGCWA